MAHPGLEIDLWKLLDLLDLNAGGLIIKSYIYTLLEWSRQVTLWRISGYWILVHFHCYAMNALFVYLPMYWILKIWGQFQPSVCRQDWGLFTLLDHQEKVYYVQSSKILNNVESKWKKNGKNNLPVPRVANGAGNHCWIRTADFYPSMTMSRYAWSVKMRKRNGRITKICPGKWLQPAWKPPANLMEIRPVIAFTTFARLSAKPKSMSYKDYYPPALCYRICFEFEFWNLRFICYLEFIRIHFGSERRIIPSRVIYRT